MFKMLLILLIVIAIVSLAIALRCLTDTNIDRRKMARAFSMRITFSLMVFFLLMIGVSLGWITPNYV
jgi:uncharacterized membrane protein YciS (DUF1049 family)